LDETRRRELIARYAEGPAVLRAAVAGLSDEELDRSPGGGEWSARQVVHHTADSELTSAIRLRRLIAEDAPVIQGYDEGLFARRLHYDARPIAASLAAVDAARASTLDLLAHLTPEEWSRAGTHSESGAYSVESWLEIYAAHCHDHADQARRAVGSTKAGAARA
jgi:hypothetical protein